MGAIRGLWRADLVMLSLDLHTHSKHSDDSWLEPAEIMRLAKGRGMDGVAITDHLTARGGFEARSINKDPGFCVIPGVEYPTEAGHVLGLFVERELELEMELEGSESLDDLAGLESGGGCRGGGNRSAASCPRVFPLAVVVRAIHAQGGIAVLAHPFESRKRLPPGIFGPSNRQDEQDGQGGLSGQGRPDVLEAFNARACARRNPQANAEARDYALKNGIPVTGGSDAHLAREVGRAGCRIAGLEPGASLRQIKQAILEGRAEPFGADSPRRVIPMTQWAKMAKARQYGRAPAILARLALASTGPVGVWLENMIRRPLEE